MNADAKTIVDDLMPQGFLRKLLPDRPSENDLLVALGLPGHGQATMQAQSDAFRTLHLPVMEALRAAGQLEPCPNLGGRTIHRVLAWNRFVSDGAEPLGRYGLYDLADAPLPRMAALEVMNRTFEELRQELRQERRDNAAVMAPLPEAVAGQVIDLAENVLREVYSNAVPVSRVRASMECDLTGRHLGWGGTAFAPLLWDGNRAADPIELPRLACHVELPCPSGQLVIMAQPSQDAVLIEVLESHMTPEQRNDATLAGHLERARSVYEATGGVWASIAAVRTHLIEEGGVLRLAGLRDEFRPEGVTGWSCDLWAPLLIDRENLRQMICAHLGETTTARLVLDRLLARPWTRTIDTEAGADLHIYMPSPGNESEFGSRFKASGLRAGKRIRDHVVLAPQPLDVDPAMMSQTHWKKPETSTISYAETETEATPEI